MITMYKYNININNFNLTDNIYVKFLGKENSQFGYWKYVINNIEYFIPNYGYMVIIDSNYKDILNEDDSLIKETDSNYKVYKQTGHIFKIDKTNNNIKKNNNRYNDIKKNIIKNMKDIFNFDEHFGHSHTTMGGIKPDDTIQNLFDDINTFLTLYYIDPQLNINYNYYTLNIDRLFYKHFYNFLHNKIGTKITSDDLNFIERDFLITTPKKGQIYVNQDDIFVLCVSDNISMTYTCYFDDPASNVQYERHYIKRYEYLIIELDRDDDDKATRQNTKSINELSIKEYNSNKPLEQNYKLVDNKFTRDNLIETYILNTF